MSDIHIYLEREQPVKVITLEPTGARGPVGPQGPAGPAGPNSVTSATTSNGTAELSLESVSIGGGTTTATLDVTQLQIINDINEVVATSSGVVVASYLESGTSQASLTADSIQIGATGGGSVNIYATGSADFSGEVTAANLTVTPSGSLILTSTNSGGFVSINGEAATDARTVAFPDASGTVALFDGSGNLTVSGTLFANHIHGNIAGNVYTHVRAGEALTKGDPVYISGSHGTAPNIVPIVMRADASNAAKMPAIGIVDADIANNANGHAVITGVISDINTNAYAVNTVLYVASGGGFTSTPPAANSQPVAIVERSNTNNGAVIVKVNGLASNGGNGVSDANKLVRFSSAGEIPVASIGGLGTGVGTALTNTTNGTGGFVTADGTATLTNKTLTNPTIDTISGAAVSNVLQNRAGSTRPICVLFEDFPGLTGSGTHPWNDAGTGSTDAFATGGAGNFMGTCRLVTGTTSGNTRSRSLGIASSNIFIGAIVRYGFAIPDITTVNVSIGFAGGGSVCQLYYQSAANSGQWTLQTNAGVSTFTSATPQAGNYFSGKRYQVEIERVSATQTRILLEIADFNLANWSTVHSGTITHSSVSGNWGECTPSFNVVTQTNAARTLVVDWASLHLPMILR